MKKFLAIVLVTLVIVGILSGCNMGVGVGNFTFTHLHLDTYHDTGCYTVDKWYDAKNGIEVKTKEIGSIFCSEGTYILLENEDDCPFCNKENKE